MLSYTVFLDGYRILIMLSIQSMNITYTRYACQDLVILFFEKWGAEPFRRTREPNNGKTI